MKKNETQFYNNENLLQNDIIKLKCGKSKINTSISNYSFLKSKNKTSYIPKLFKNSSMFNNYSKRISKKLQELTKSDINYISNKKTIPKNSVHIRRISAKNNRTKFFPQKTCYMKKNNNNIFLLNIKKIKNEKKNFNKHNFSFGQKNDYNDYNLLYKKDDLIDSSFYSKNKNPFINNNNKKYYINADKLKINYLKHEELNKNSIKDENKHISNFSFNNSNSCQNISNSFRINNYNYLKKNKGSNILKKPNQLLFDYNDSIPDGKSNLINELKDDKKINNYQENIEYNKSNDKEKIIDDNYNEYLKSIASSESNNSINELKNPNNKYKKILIKGLKPLKDKLSLNNANKTFQYEKNLNKNNYSNIMIQKNENNKRLFKYKKNISNRRKNSDDISKSIVIENLYVRKKLLLVKNVLN